MTLTPASTAAPNTINQSASGDGASSGGASGNGVSSDGGAGNGVSSDGGAGDGDGGDVGSTWGLQERDSITPDLYAWDLLSVGPRFEMWAAWSLERLAPLCVKIPRRDALTEAVIGALRREHAATSSFSHPSIPRCFGFDLDARIPYLAVEWVDGDSLSEFISTNGPMDDNDVLHAGLQTLAALRHIHACGFVHHDLKPGNLLVRDGRIVVIDFDLALPIGGLRSKTKARGTHSWMSPEQISCQPAAPSMDLFALGAVLYRAATATSPFTHPDRKNFGSGSTQQPRVYVQLEGTRPPVAEAAPQLSAPVAAAIERLLELDPRKRPATADAAIDLLVSARPETEEPLWPDWVTRASRAQRPKPAVGRRSGHDVRTGSGTAVEFCRGLTADERAAAIVVVDAQLQDNTAVARVLDTFADAPAASVVPVDADADNTDSLLALADQVAAIDPAMIVALGGGSTIDAARLAMILACNPDGRAEKLANPDSTGLTRLDLASLTLRPVVAMSTTIGTGVEVSPVACYTHDGVKRMVAHELLQPSVGVIDPDLTSSLPPSAVESGLVEATLRYLGPFLSKASDKPTADEQATLEMRGLVALLEAHRSIGLSDDQRFEASLRSANTRLGMGLAGRGSYGAKLWYLATALTDLADLSKVDANLLLLPTLLRRVAAGDTRYGTCEQLAAAMVALGADESRGIAALLGGPAADLPELPTAAAVADHAATYWGGNLPCLGKFSTDDLTDFYTEALTS